MSVLVVEDEAPIRHLVRNQLESQGVPVEEAGTVTAALELMSRRTYTVVILDLTLPDGSGLTILDNLRRSGSESHVIVLSGATSEADRLNALQRGADDYVVKPFFARELTARVLAVRRRRDPTKDMRLEVGPIMINLRARIVMMDGAPLELTAKEFDLLAYLAARPGHVFSREQLLQTVWQSSSDWQQDATVTEHVRRLRAKIEKDPSRPKVLVTVRGAGYRLEGAPAEAPMPAASSEEPPVDGSGNLILSGETIVFADQAAAELFGLDQPGDLLGTSIISHIAEQSLGALDRRTARIESESSVRSESFAIRHADGSEPRVTLTSQPTEWDGEPGRHLVLSRGQDPSSQLLHMAVGVFSELTEVVIVTDLNFHLRSWNGAAERLYGWQQHEVLGRHVLDILPWAGEEGVLGRAWQALEAKGRWKGRGRHPARDGSMIEVFASLSVLRSEAGEMIGIACIHRQIAATPSAEPEEASRLPDVADIKRGLAADEFEVHYQPVVRLEDGAVLGVEALLRWNHRNLGLLTPDAFLAVAERTGVIVELGNFALERACQQTARWVREGFDLEVAVNLSTRQLVEPNVVDRVAAALQSSGLAADRLWLEVTETTLVEDVDKAAEVLHLLVLHGVRIAIDDFGTGWASLTYLRTFPVHALKIDRSFVARVDQHGSDTAIARSILSLAAELDMAVVAEGIETTAQAQALRELGCITGQGYLYGAPAPAADLALERVTRTGDEDSTRDRIAPPLAVAAAPARLATHRPNGAHAVASGASGSPARVAAAVTTHVREPVMITNERAESDAVTNLLRGLLRVRSAGAAVELLHLTIRRLGATVVLAADAGPDALPLDVSLGEGPPLLPVAEPMSVARLQLERILPRLVEDTRHAVALLRQRERFEDDALGD